MKSYKQFKQVLKESNEPVKDINDDSNDSELDRKVKADFFQKTVTEDQDSKYLYLKKGGKKETKIESEIDKVVLQLHKQKATAATKFVEQLKEVIVQKKALDEQESKMKDDARGLFDELFEAKDAVYTRVIETLSITLTLGKIEQPKPKFEFNEEGFFEEVSKKVMPEVLDLLNILRKKFTTDVTPAPKQSKVLPKLKEGVVGSFLKSLRAKFVKIDTVLHKWREEILKAGINLKEADEYDLDDVEHVKRRVAGSDETPNDRANKAEIKQNIHHNQSIDFSDVKPKWADVAPEIVKKRLDWLKKMQKVIESHGGTLLCYNSQLEWLIYSGARYVFIVFQDVPKPEALKKLKLQAYGFRFPYEKSPEVLKIAPNYYTGISARISADAETLKNQGKPFALGVEEALQKYYPDKFRSQRMRFNNHTLN